MDKVVFIRAELELLEFCINCVLGAQAITAASVDESNAKLFAAAVEIGVLVAPVSDGGDYTLADKYDELTSSNVSIEMLNDSIGLAIIAKPTA